MLAKDLCDQFPNKEKSVEDLISFINNGLDDSIKYTLFLGAGASKTSGISTAHDLVKNWRDYEYKKLSKDIEPKDDEYIKNWLNENQANWYDINSEYSSLFERKYSMKKMRRDFIETEVSKKHPSIGYAYLVKIAEKKALNTIFTTNFDDLLNEAFYQFSTHRPIVCAHDSEVDDISVASTRTKLIKLHGDYLFQDLKSTTSETRNLTSNMEDKLKEFSKLFGIIMCGYSGSDKSIMNIMSNMLNDKQLLQNGVLWCFRRDDIINDTLKDFLKREGFFYVIIDGFDELMAEIYSNICGNALPFTARPGSDLASRIVNGYLEDENLKKSNSSTIRQHLEMLSMEQNSSMVVEAIQSLNNEQNKNPSINDTDMLKYIEIEKLFYSRNYDDAFSKIQGYIYSCDNADFKKILLRRLFYCSKSLYKNDIAKKSLESLHELDPNNLFIPVAKCEVIDCHKEKITILEEATINAPYEESISLYYAQELERQSEAGVVKHQDDTTKEIILLYQKSISLYPSIDNIAYRRLFNYLKFTHKSRSEGKQMITEIVQNFITQDAYSPTTISLIKDYCKLYKTDKFDEKSLAEWISAAYKNHYPRRTTEFLDELYTTLIENSNYSLLAEMIGDCEKEAHSRHNSEYQSVKAKITLSTYRDIELAIETCESFLKKRKSANIEKQLFHLYIYVGNDRNAKLAIHSLQGALTWANHIKLRSEYLESIGDFQGAIDLLQDLIKKENDTSTHIATISYLQIKMGEYSKAVKTCSTFLEKHSFSLKFEEIIINYEFAKVKSGKKASKLRLKSLIAESASKNVVAVAHLILGENKSSLIILFEEMEIDYLNWHIYKKWPVLDSVKKELSSESDRLFNIRRKFPIVDPELIGSN